MDDMNEDGDVTREDAVFLANIVEEKTEERPFQPFIGGLGIYSPAPHRGPFLHVDGERVQSEVVSETVPPGGH